MIDGCISFFLALVGLGFLVLIHETGHFRHALAKELQNLVQGVRSRIGQVAAVAALQGLPDGPRGQAD